MTNEGARNSYAELKYSISTLFELLTDKKTKEDPAPE